MRDIGPSVLAGALALIVVPLAADEIDGPATDIMRVNGALVESALRGSALEFVDSLRKEGVSCGLVVSSDTWQEIRSPSTKAQAANAATVALADLARAFTASHPGWEATASRSGVLVRESTIALRTDLIGDFSVTNVPLSEALVAAERLLLPTIPEVSGWVGSFLFNSRDADRRRRIEDIESQRLVTAEVSNATFYEVLDALAVAAPGTGWVLIRHADPEGEYDTLALRFADRTYSDHHWALPVRQGESAD